MNYTEYGVYLLIILVTFFMIYIPRKVQEKKIKELQSKVKVGDKVITYSGLFGTITSIDENKVVIQLEPDRVNITIDKWSIAGIE